MKAQTHQVEQLAATQCGVVSRGQATALGVSPKAQRRLVEQGQWRLQWGSLVVLERHYVPDLIDAAAIGLRLGRDAVVTGPTALRLGGWSIPDSDVVVACSPGRTPEPLPGLRLLRDDYVRRRSDRGVFTLAQPSEALLDTIRVVSESRAREIVDRALQLRWLEPDEWPRLVAPRLGRGHNGARRLRQVVELVASGTHSRAERRALQLVKRAGLRGWIPDFPLTDRRGRIIARLDLANPKLRLCVEVDGLEAHSGLEQFEHDRVRQNLIALHGWTVLRVTWRQLDRFPDEVVRTIRDAMELRASELAA